MDCCWSNPTYQRLIVKQADDQLCKEDQLRLIQIINAQRPDLVGDALSAMATLGGQEESLIQIQRLKLLWKMRRFRTK